MSLNRFDVLGELVEFVSFSNEVARGQDETAHLFEFSPQVKEAENLQHVFGSLVLRQKMLALILL